MTLPLICISAFALWLLLALLAWAICASGAPADDADERAGIARRS